MKRNFKYRKAGPFHLLFLVTLLLTIVSAIVLSFLYGHPKELSLDPSVLVERYRSGLLPKPNERFVFLFLAFVIPIFSLSAGLMFFRNRRGARSRVRVILDVILSSLPSIVPQGIRVFGSAMGNRLEPVLAIATAAVLYFPVVYRRFGRPLPSDMFLPNEHPGILAVTLF